MIGVVQDVVFETVIERRCRGLTDVPDSDRVAIERSLGDARHADRATGAADIFNNHSLTERTAHRFSNQARNRVGRELPGGSPKFDPRQRKIPVSPQNVRKRGRPMPTETLVIVLTISAIFALFAGSLAWADVYSRGSQKP